MILAKLPETPIKILTITPTHLCVADPTAEFSAHNEGSSRVIGQVQTAIWRRGRTTSQNAECLLTPIKTSGWIIGLFQDVVGDGFVLQLSHPVKSDYE